MFLHDWLHQDVYLNVVQVVVAIEVTMFTRQLPNFTRTRCNHLGILVSFPLVIRWSRRLLRLIAGGMDLRLVRLVLAALFGSLDVASKFVQAHRSVIWLYGRGHRALLLPGRSWPRSRRGPVLLAAYHAQS